MFASWSPAEVRLLLSQDTAPSSDLFLFFWDEFLLFGILFSSLIFVCQESLYLVLFPLELKLCSPL